MRCSSARQLGLDLADPREAGRHVLAQGGVGARRALIVQSHTNALAEHDLAGVGPDLSGEHPQQGRLARAVAAGERHPLAAVELEREIGEQSAIANALGEAGGRDDGHGGPGVLDRGRLLGGVLADLEGGAAAAGGDHVRVVDRKPAP